MTRRSLARDLATALLSGPWAPLLLRVRLKQVFQPRRRSRWLDGIVQRAVARFGSANPPPRRDQLVRFIQSDGAFHRFCLRNELDRGIGVSTSELPRPQMTPAAALAGLDLPPLVTPGELAGWLKLSIRQLDRLADCQRRERLRGHPDDRNYRYRWVMKRDGRRRLLEIPAPVLRRVQRQILDAILNHVPPHDCAHAFRSGRSVATYVQPHAGRSLVITIDLCNFFPSIRSSRVQALLRWLGYPEPVARLLAGLCTNTVPGDVLEECASSSRSWQSVHEALRMAHLPQGAPTSPALANLCAYRLDCRLAGLAARFGGTYTRYADDLTFSGGEELSRGCRRLRVLACAIAIDEGFSIQHRKTRVMHRGGRQQVAGIRLNEHPNIPRGEFDRLKAILHNSAAFGPESQNCEEHPNFREHLRGRIAYATMINPERGAKLQRIFDSIDWN